MQLLVSRSTMKNTSKYCAESGVSLMEMLVVVAVMGILSAVAIPYFDRVYENSRRTVAENTVQTLNDGVKKYIQIQGTGILDVPASGESYAEELDIILALQWDDPNEPANGAPYVQADYGPSGSSSTEDYRAVWNGAFFELVEPGTAGAGLKINFDSSDYGQSVTFAEGYSPLSGY